MERANLELGLYIDFDEICRNYLEQNDEDWFEDRLMDSVCDPENSFTREDCDTIADVLLKLSQKMQRCANDILSAKYLSLDDMPDDELRELSQKVYGDDDLLEARIRDRESK